MNKKLSFFLSALIILILSAVLFFLFVGNPFNINSEFDRTDQKNDKIVNMFNTEIEKQINEHTQSTMHPGFISESRQNTIDYLKTIKTIESYAQHGATSTQPRNYIKLKITFNNGNIVKDIHTGDPCNAYLEPCLLMKIEMNDGKATNVFTNGQERKNSPEKIIPNINTLINHAIAYDISKNRNNYFEPAKTQNDFNKEWEKQK